MNNPDSTNNCVGLERFVVIFADDCMPEKVWCDEIETECLLLSTANVIANDDDEAIALASQAGFDGHHRPVAALTLSDLVAMAEALVRCPFNAAAASRIPPAATPRPSNSNERRRQITGRLPCSKYESRILSGIHTYLARPPPHASVQPSEGPL